MSFDRIYSKVITVAILSLLAASFSILATSDLHTGQADVREYCLNEENFEAKCLKSELIVVSSAAYGRMRIGRCLEPEGHQLLTTMGHDPLFLGCSVDVLPLLNRRCSGRNQCLIRAADPDLKKEKPCHVALQKYLEVAYQCVTVVEEERSCIVLATSNPLHIMRSSSSSSKRSCGTNSQPWRLEAPAGQQINVSLLDFGSQTADTLYQLDQNSCQQYGYIIDKSARRNVSLCEFVNGRITGSAYRSASNVVDVYMSRSLTVDSEADMQSQQFLLRLAAVGCSNLVPPIDSWLRRNDNEAVVGCYSSRQTWHLRCIDNQWIGVVGNCTRDLLESSVEQSEPIVQHSDHYQVIIIVAIGFLALVACLILICCAAVLLRRHYSKVASKYIRKVDDIEKYKYFNVKPELQSTQQQNNTRPINESV